MWHKLPGSVVSDKKREEDPSWQRLYEARKGKKDERLFQLIADHCYPHNPSALKNKKLALHCWQTDNLGDVSQLFLCASIIKKLRPEYEMNLVIQLEGIAESTIKKIFPTDQYTTKFLLRGSKEGQEYFEDLAAQGYYFLGIAVGSSFAGTFLRSHPHFRNIREHGFDFHVDTSGNILSMGLGDKEEGVNVPVPLPHSHAALQTRWLAEALQSKNARRLYHQYVPSITIKAAGLYSIAAIEKGKNESIDVFMNLEHSLKELIEWKMIDTNFLKEQGTGRLVCVKERKQSQATTASQVFSPESFEEEVIELGTGTEMRILSGTINKADFETIQRNSEAFFGCTGDVTFSEGVGLKKFIFYDSPPHKMAFHTSYQALAKKRGLTDLSSFMEVMSNIYSAETKIRDKYIKEHNDRQPKPSMFLPRLEPSYELTNAKSIPRLSAPELMPELRAYATQIARLYNDPHCRKEMQELNEYICQNCNFNPRLLASVDRGIFLQNFPEVFEVEKLLLEQFKAGAIDEASVKKQLLVAIEKALNPEKTATSGPPSPQQSKK